MRKIPKENYWELAVFLMDYHSGQFSRGYRLLCRLSPNNFSASFCAEMRETEMYAYLESRYANKV
jgi:hypothetical protein